MANKKLNFANFVCRFGDQMVLVDQLEEVVIPAFFDDREKTTSKSRVFLHDVSMIEQADNRHVIAGRIVKDTVLEREKLFDNETKTLKDSARTLRSSPTSFFALVVETHRLIFVPEHRGSPTLKTFQSLMRRFLLDAYVERYGKVSKKKELSSEMTGRPPSPELEIVPMMSAGSLEVFLKRFDLIQQLSIRVAEVNNEFDNSELIEDVRESHRRMKSSDTELRYKNMSEGLSRKEVSSEIEAIGKGTGHVNVKGKDSEGRKIEGNNEHFGVKSEVKTVPDDILLATDVVFSEFEAMISSGAIDAGEASDSTNDKVKSVFESME